jgi:hypothetical protein
MTHNALFMLQLATFKVTQEGDVRWLGGLYGRPGVGMDLTSRGF